MMTGTEISSILAAYLLGCFTTGYYWVRWRAGLDIRYQGSGSVGAKNVGRLLGASGFTATLLGDFAKGALAVWVAAHFGLRPEALIAVMLAVVAGHSWPIQLRFHGGKGIATSLGAILVYDWFVAVLLGVLFLAVFLSLRNFTLGGLLAFAALPLTVFLCGLPNLQVAAVSLLAILILVTHRKNLREEFAGMFTTRTVKESLMQRPKHTDHEG